MKRRSEFLDTILEFNPNYDIELIGHAYDVAEEMHRGQLRKSGEFPIGNAIDSTSPPSGEAFGNHLLQKVHLS